MAWAGLLEWAMFLALSTVAVATAAGMLLTMSMYRAGLALLSSFVALAGLFLLLDADLLAAIQVMMNVGGMLVMVLFMVMLMMDPGGEMMWDMKRKMHLSGPGAFSMSMPRGAPPAEESRHSSDRSDEGQNDRTYTCPMHPEVRQQGPGTCPKCGMDLVPAQATGASAPPHTGESTKAPAAAAYTCPMHPEVKQDQPGTCPKCGMELVPSAKDDHADGDGEMPDATAGTPGGADDMGHETGETVHDMAHDMGRDMGGMSPRQHRQMMVDMAMSTAQLPWALGIGAASAVLMAALAVRTPWPLSSVGPTQDATAAVGELLLSRYMIGFEGAAFLILGGIVGAVVFGKREGGPPAAAARAGDGSAEVARASGAAGAASRRTYACPMHPDVRQQGSGTCPQCGMELMPTAAVEHQQTPAWPAMRGTQSHDGDHGQYGGHA